MPFADPPPAPIKPPASPEKPRVTVLMSAYNRADLIGQSIESILAQTFTDFELVIVDDCSTDSTPEVIARYNDPRIRLLRNAANLGVVETRNRGAAAARGDYIAALDDDDLSRSTRLARQVAYLDAHPEAVLVGCAGHVLENGALRPFNQERITTPLFLKWMLLLKNPLIYSSIMVRAETIRTLGRYMDMDCQWAEDYNLYFKCMAHGEIAQVDEPQVIYRLFSGNASRLRRDEMMNKTAKVLARAFAEPFGEDAPQAADLIARHVAAATPVTDAPTLGRLGGFLRILLHDFCARHKPSPVEQALIHAHMGRIWWHTVRAAARVGDPRMLKLHAAYPELHDPRRPVAPTEHLRAAAMGAMPGREIARTTFRRISAGFEPARLPPQLSTRLYETQYIPAGLDADRVPTLFVSVDTEAEFDWSLPFDRSMTGVTNMAAQSKAQAIFDNYGLRPVYLIDYPVASQPQGYEPLRSILARDGCEIGAHPHPWTTPPFDEEVNEFNSYPGNLPKALEAAKLSALISAIRANLGVDPVYYKAGRYGIGPATIELLGSVDTLVDFSLLPGANLSSRHGPDFRRISPISYRTPGTSILSMPMTSGAFGPLAAWEPGVAGVLDRNPARALRVRNILSRLRLLDRATLTPENTSLDDQIRLVRSLLRRGHRMFVLHYHSPSLVPGNTPYVRNETEAAEFLERLRGLCRYFFETLGGIPGNPRSLLPPHRQSVVAETSR